MRPDSAEENFDVAVVGGGPAGLRAAEVAAQQGAKVAVFDAKASVGRKFLVAGRGGLNLTHAEDTSTFVGRYRSSVDSAAEQAEESRQRWSRLLSAFGPSELREWAAGLGVETFVASTGRVYPKEMKAAPLLRRWMERLRSLGVSFRMRHRLVDLNTGGVLTLTFRKDATGAGPDHHTPFDTGTSSADTRERHAGAGSERKTIVAAGAVVLAMGGASWPQTGSDGNWAELLRQKGVSVSALLPANCGWECEWPAEVLAACAGKPLKNLLVSAGSLSVRGELLVTRYGLEGGAIYSLSRALREMSNPELSIDFKPNSTRESLLRRLGTARSNFLSEARQRWRLDDSTHTLVAALARSEAFCSAETTVSAIKELVLGLSRPRPVSEAISTAGGVLFSSVDGTLMLRRHAGVFVAGEMLEWEAPTGGYLLQGCFATGTIAGAGAAQRACVKS